MRETENKNVIVQISGLPLEFSEKIFIEQTCESRIIPFANTRTFNNALLHM